jgi:hypothetical protein
MNNLIILECKKIRFYSTNDKNAFFEWIKKAKYIKEFKGEKDKILLYVKKKLTNPEALDLVALFRRYKINTKQLEIFFDSERSLEDYKQHSSYCVYPSKT